MAIDRLDGLRAEIERLTEANAINTAAHNLLRAHNAELLKLRKAAQVVYDGLNARIDAAAKAGSPTPVFDGIAALSAILAKLAKTEGVA